MGISDQYYAGFCPCLLARDMCDHVGGSGCQGCLFSIACPACFQCYLAPKIAAKSGIEESMVNSVLKTCCCTTCYGNSVVGEYFKQKKDDVEKGKPPTTGLSPTKNWVIGIQEQWYAGCCSCLLAKDMFEYVDESGMMGCFLRCFLPPVFLCCVGPKIADKGDIDESYVNAALKAVCPCPEACYAASVYVEYKYQKSEDKKPSQMEMQ